MSVFVSSRPPCHDDFNDDQSRDRRRRSTSFPGAFEPPEEFHAVAVGCTCVWSTVTEPEFRAAGFEPVHQRKNSFVRSSTGSRHRAVYFPETGPYVDGALAYPLLGYGLVSFNMT
jgi:hypothetical protein